MTTTVVRASIMGIALALTLGSGLGSSGVAGEGLWESSLKATEDSGQPSGISTDWMAAQGEAKVVARQGEQDVVELEARNLVPNGLYTVWWVNKGTLGMDMGPGGGSPDNEFRADANGNATVKIEVPSNSNYQMMVVAYHADNQTHGKSPGEMGKTTFNHLIGPWPGPAGETSG